MESGKFCGDVEFEGVKEKVFFIILVLGGVGLMIIMMFVYNIVKFVKCMLL